MPAQFYRGRMIDVGRTSTGSKAKHAATGEANRKKARETAARTSQLPATNGIPVVNNKVRPADHPSRNSKNVTASTRDVQMGNKHVSLANHSTNRSGGLTSAERSAAAKKASRKRKRRAGKFA